MKWLKNYFTRKDTRWEFWKEDMKLSLMCYAIIFGIFGAYYGREKYLDWKDKRETQKRLEDSKIINEMLRDYCEREKED